MDALGAENTDPEDTAFYTNTFNFLKEVIENLDIEIIERSYDDNYSQIKELYERVEKLEKGDYCE